MHTTLAFVLLFATACTAVPVHPIYGMDGTLPETWFVHSTDARYVAIDNIGGHLGDDAVAYAASSADAATVTCFVDPEQYSKQLHKFMGIAFIARLILNRAAASETVDWENTVPGKHLVVSTIPRHDTDLDGLAKTIDEQLHTAHLHVNSPFSGSIFGDSGTDIVLADTFEGATVVIAENRGECDDGECGGGDGITLERFSGCCADMHEFEAGLQRLLGIINLDFPGSAAASLVRQSVKDAMQMYENLMLDRVVVDGRNEVALVEAHTSSANEASHVLGRLLAGAGNLLVLAQEELTSRMTDALSRYTFDQRAIQNKQCSDFGEHSRDEFARMLTHADAESASQDQLLEIAREAVAKHLDTAAQKRTLEACPLRDDSFIVHVYSRISELVGSRMLDLKESMLDVSAAQLRHYRAMLERAADSNPRLSHEELYTVHQQALAGCKDAFQQHFGRYRERDDVETHRSVMLANLHDVWTAIDRRNNESISELCKHSAGVIAKRYAGYINNIYGQFGSEVDIADTKNKMRDDATATYEGLVAKYRSNKDCRAAGYMIASEVRDLHAEFKSTKDKSDFGRILWGGERLVSTLLAQGSTLLWDVSTLLQKNAIGVVIGLLIAAFSWFVYIATSRRSRKEATDVDADPNPNTERELFR